MVFVKYKDETLQQKMQRLKNFYLRSETYTMKTA